MASRTILITSTVFDAARCMRDLRATALAVRGHDGSLRGIVSEQDLIKRCLLKGLDARLTSVEAIMTSGVEFVTVSQARGDIVAVQRRLAELGIKHMPVVSDMDDRTGMRRCVGCLDIITVSNEVRDRAVERRVRPHPATTGCALVAGVQCLMLMIMIVLIWVTWPHRVAGNGWPHWSADRVVAWSNVGHPGGKGRSILVDRCTSAPGP